MQSLWFALLCTLGSLANTNALEAAAGPEFDYDPGVSKPLAPDPWPRYHYKSSTLDPPVLKVTQDGEALAPGLVFITPERNGVLGALLYDTNGELVWNGYHRRLVSNFKTATVDGKKVLSTWVGRSSTRGWGYGGVSLLNKRYKEIRFVCPKLGIFVPKFDRRPAPECDGDLHESEITEDGHLLVTAYNITRQNLRSVGGPRNGWVVDGQFHVIDLATGNPIFSWKSLDHVALSESGHSLGGAGKVATHPYDYFHINAVQQVPGQDQYLISSRHTSSIFLIDGSSGAIIWTFRGSDGGDFAPLPSAPNQNQHFAYQHDARVLGVTANTMTISMFNNDGAQFNHTNHASTGLVYRLNTQTMKADLIRVVHDRNEELFSYSQGSFNILPTSEGRHFLIGYGFNPVIKEFGPNGTIDLRWSARFGHNRNQQFYRAFKDTWHATPTEPPDIAVDSNNVYVSWNGATDVTRYVLSYGTTRSNLNQKQEFDKTGFETASELPTSLTETGGYLRVVAFKGATLLGRSAIKRVRPSGS